MTAATLDPTWSPAEAAPVTADVGYRRRWLALFVILAGGVMELLDATVTNIAGPTMRADLGGSASTIQWLGAAYVLAMTAGLLTGGRLGDIYGRRRMFVIGALGFTVGSLLCAVAQSPETLIAARVIQGLFGAAMVPQGFGLIKEMFPPAELQSAFALFGPVLGLSAVAGPILAGWLVDADVAGTGWRMIFLVNLPVGLAAAAGALRLLPESRSPHPLRLDVPGVVLASIASLLLIYPLVQGREHGWPAWAFAMIAASGVMFGVFGAYQVRKGRRGGDPLVVPSLFRKRAFTAGLLAGMVLFGCMAGFTLVLNLYTQLTLGYSPLKAGLTGVPFSVGMILGMGVMQSLKRFGRKVLLAGAIVKIVGIVTVIAIIDAGPSPWRLAPALAVAGAGTALLMGPYFDFVLAGVEPHEAGSASGTLTAVQQLGSAFGIALLGTVFFSASIATVLATVAGLLAVIFAVGFLLPKHAGQG